MIEQRRPTLARWAAVAFVLALSACQPPEVSDPADQVLRSGKILTVDPESMKSIGYPPGHLQTCHTFGCLSIVQIKVAAAVFLHIRAYV